METVREYYQRHGAMTEPCSCAAELCALPRNVGQLCQVIQGVTIHRDMAPFFYGLKLSEEHYGDANIRPIPAILAQIHARDDRPLTAARQKDNRFGGVCRHFSLTP